MQIKFYIQIHSTLFNKLD